MSADKPDLTLNSMRGNCEPGDRSGYLFKYRDSAHTARGPMPIVEGRSGALFGGLGGSP